ncbi:hypothetical protein CON22_27985 [Bacillus cereus]|nr:hypothetical protein CON22_27985 [Bacillus cereus]
MGYKEKEIRNFMRIFHLNIVKFLYKNYNFTYINDNLTHLNNDTTIYISIAWLLLRGISAEDLEPWFFRR